jgi:cell division protein ZapA
MEKKTIKVNIWGIEYGLKSDADPQYIQELAAYVDQKMRKLSEGTVVKSQLKIAVLAALNIADELFRLKLKHEKLIKEIEQTSDELTENLESYLDQYTSLLK